LIAAGIALPTTAAHAAEPEANDPASLVNPFLGTTNAGDTFPGADAPFGMVQWSPDTTNRAPSGNYEYKDNKIQSFSLTHISGAGCNAEADIPIMPTVGGIDQNQTATFSHGNESASAGQYSVKFDNGIQTELTTTKRSGMARFTFPQTGQANLLFKLGQAGTSTGDIVFTKVSQNEVSGRVTSGHFCASGPTYTLYFDMVFDRSFTSNGTITNGGSVTFDASSDRDVLAKVGISYVSAANAVQNRAQENPGWDFNATRTAAHDAWNDLLTRIKVTGGTHDQQVVFYTALYHALLHPNVYSDVNGQYMGFDYKVHSVSGNQKAQYATFSGWDVYRSQAQLHALVDPTSASDAAQSLINDYNQGQLLPKWSLNHAETFVMNGDSAPSIIADYYAFGARNFDTAAAKNAMVKQATVFNGIRTGGNYLSDYGYLPSNADYPYGFYGTVATLLEYNQSDHAIGQFAGALGDTATRDQFVNRAQAWRNAFNPATGFMQGKEKNGSWTAGFNPASTDQKYFVEGSSWQYTGMVPFNLRGLADAMGGNAKLAAYLDSALSQLKGEGNTHADMGNEPSMALPWEYAYIGQPWKTQETVRRVQNQLWPNNPTGWNVGNDDLGTMSAWYVFSALGMYPNVPGTSDMVLGSALFTKAVVKLGNGGTLTISAPDAATIAPYVQSASFNGSAWNNAYLPTSALTSGGTFTFNLGTSANTSWATAASAAPPSYNGNGGALPPRMQVPAVGAVTSGLAGLCLDVDNGAFNDNQKIQVWSCNNSNAQRWTYPGDGTLQIGGKCADVAGSGTANGSKIGLWGCNLTNGQQFVYNPTTKQLVNRNSGRCVDVNNSASGTQLTLWDCNDGQNQKWNVPKVAVGAVANGVAGKCLDDDHASTQNGTHIQIWSCNGSDAQKVTLPGDGTLQVLGRCVDTSGASADGTKVVLWECIPGNGNQQWKYDAPSGHLVNPQTGKCLDNPGGSTADGTQLDLWTCGSGANQKWTIPTA